MEGCLFIFHMCLDISSLNRYTKCSLMCLDTYGGEKMRKNSVRKLTIAALLIAMGVIIPMIMPKIVIGPASFTLASHVPLFAAMFFSPQIAVAVALGTAFGFLLTAPFIIALRALSHVIFAIIGSLYLQKHPEIVNNNKKFQWYNVWIGLIHALAELIVVAIVLIGGNQTQPDNMLLFIFGFIGVGGFIHSLIDYNIALFVMRALSKTFDIPVFAKAKEMKLKR